MKLTRIQREAVRAMFGGRCAYCGNELGAKWHADHVEAVFRVTRYVRGKGYVATGELNHPEHDTADNMFPACVPCNIDKGMCNPEDYRAKLQRSHDLLLRNYSAYRHAIRLGVVKVNPEPVVFYFERLANAAPHLAGRASPSHDRALMSEAADTLADLCDVDPSLCDECGGDSDRCPSRCSYKRGPEIVTRLRLATSTATDSETDAK